MSDAVARLVREKVSSGADAGVGSRFGVSVAADGSRSGRVPGVAGGLPVGVGPRGDDHPVDPFAGLSMPPPVLGRVSLYDEPVGDPLVEIA